MATKKPAEKPAEKTKARVLLDCAYGKVDQVIEIEAADLAVAQASGHVDTDPAAVAYAESRQ
jgi:hypothetical protein